MSATEAQADAAIAILERMIVAARNSNQAGEDAVVAAAAAPDLLETMKDFAEWEPESGVTLEHLAAWMKERARAAIAKAEGAQ
jgi:hypothetical protein